MNDGNPPSSWYDPPEAKYAYEINAERNPAPGTICEREGCRDDGYKIVEVRDMARPYVQREIAICKNHYESVIEDETEAAESYQPDYDDED